jgi:hypothetical protein
MRDRVRRRIVFERIAEDRAVSAFKQFPLAFEPAPATEDGAQAFLVRAGLNTARVARTGVAIRAGHDAASVSVRFVGASRDGSVERTDRLPGYVNYLIGSDPAKWRTRVPTFAHVRARDVYDGIDVHYYGTPQGLEYDFVVRPHADPSAIRLSLEGGTPRMTRDGDLTVDGTVVQRRPVGPVACETNRWRGVRFRRGVQDDFRWNGHRPLLVRRRHERR